MMQEKKEKKHTLLLLQVTTLLFVSAVFVDDAQAMVIRLGEEQSIESYATVEDDLYTFGEFVTVLGTTTGDVFAGGLKHVEQGGVVLEDAFLAGRSVLVSGPVFGDVRALGDSVVVSGHITEDALLFGNSITVEKDAVIEGDMFIIGGYVYVAGTVHGSSVIRGRTVKLEGTMHKDVEVHADESLGVTAEANLQGDLVYSAPRKAFISGTATLEGGTTFTQTTPPSTTKRSSTSVLAFVLMNVVASFLLLLLFPAHVRHVASASFSGNVFLNILKALLLFFLLPVIAFLFLATGVGALPGLVVFLLYLVLLTFAIMFVPIIGSALIARMRHMEGKEYTYPWVFFSVATISLVMYLSKPLGIVMWSILFFLALYGGCLSLYTAVRTTRQSLTEEDNEKKERTSSAVDGEKKESA